jgi:hypothetical protein
MIEKDELFSKLEALASAFHIPCLPATNAFEDNQTHRYRFVRVHSASPESHVQLV